MTCCSLPGFDCTVCGTWVPYDAIFEPQGWEGTESFCSSECHAMLLRQRSDDQVPSVVDGQGARQ